MKQRAGSKVFMLCNFCAPKRANRAVMKFSCFSGEDTLKSWTQTNLKRNRLKFLHLGPSELSGPKMLLVPNPYFRTEIGNSYAASSEISSRQQKQSLPIFKPDRHPVGKIHYVTPISRILLGAFVAAGDPTVS